MTIPFSLSLSQVRTWALAGGLLLAAVVPTAARAHGESETSAVLSGLSIGVPIASAAAVSTAVLVAGAGLVVVAVQASATGTVWVLERLSDGARIVLRLSQQGLEGGRVALGTAVTVVALSTGWVLAAGGQALCFVPNEQGQRLLYDERVTP